MICCKDIITYLDQILQKNQYFSEQPSIWRDVAQPVHRVGLVLEPDSELPAWIQVHRIDTLFLHRPWKIETFPIPEYMGIITYHLPFDEKLTLGYNQYLAKEMHLQSVEPFGAKDGRPIGMIGNVSSQTDWEISINLQNLFGGMEELVHITNSPVSKVAVVGAMSEELIKKAAAQDVDLYITGQLRNAARKAAIETGIRALAIGHTRIEMYGLCLLEKILKNKWPMLSVFVKH